MFPAYLTCHTQSRNAVHMVGRTSDKEYTLNIMLYDQMLNEFPHSRLIVYAHGIHTIDLHADADNRNALLKCRIA